MMSQRTLRYRGTNQAIKQQLEQDKATQRNKESAFSTSAVMTATSQAFLDETRFAAPPAGKKVSYAYGIEPGFLDALKKHAPEFSMPTIKNLYDTIISLIKETPAALKSLYDTASPEEKSFVKTVTSATNNHYIGQAVISTLGINPLLYALILMTYRISFTTAQASNTTRSLFTFFNGAPVNGTDLCAGTTANLCSQFYVSQNNATVMQGASYLTSTKLSTETANDVAGQCGDITHLQSFLQDLIFANPDNTLVGNQTCSTAAYSDGRTIHLDNQLTGVNEPVCAALTQDSNSVITPCVQQNVAAYDANQQYPDPSTTQQHQSSSISPVVYIMPVFFVAIVLPIIMRSRIQNTGNRRRAYAEPAVNPDQQQQPAAAAPEQIELASIHVVPAPPEQAQVGATAEDRQSPQMRP
jgi:hypothetical protein